MEEVSVRGVKYGPAGERNVPSMRFDGVCRQTDQLDASLGELGLELCESAQLGGADWSVVLGMGEENSPLIANPVVEINGAIGGFRLEIGGSGAQSKSCYSVNMIAVIETRQPALTVLGVLPQSIPY